MGNYIDSSWKNIAQGNTAFCILGGPSISQVENLQEIIQNNFTITVNHNIQFYPNADMYVTADNSIAREYFEDNYYNIKQVLIMMKNRFGFKEKNI